MARPADRDAAADDIARRVLASGKYGSLDQSLVHRVAAESAERVKDKAQAVKYAKRKLHQAYGAFINSAPGPAIRAMIASVQSGAADLRTAAMGAMRAHASTAERLDWLDEFYAQVADWCGTPASVVDLACGLNPLAIPWMTLATNATYHACDIDTDLVTALAQLDEIMPARLRATTCDLVSGAPPAEAELALMLKTVTTLEQQRDGAARALLMRLRCDHVVLSLPRASLSGRHEYLTDPQEIVRASVDGTIYRACDEAAFGTELLIHLKP